MSVDIDLSEVSALAAELAASGAKVQAQTESKVLSKAGASLRDLARSSAPVATGELQGSIYVRGGRGWRIIGSDARQGFYQEFGTSVMPPQPWLWQHVAAVDREMYNELEQLGDPFV